MALLDFLKTGRALIGDLAAEVANLKSQLEAKKQRRDFLNTSPLPRSEFADKVIAKLLAQCHCPDNGFVASLEGSLKYLIHSPHDSLESDPLNLFCIASGGVQSNGVKPENFLWLIGPDIIEERVRAAIKVMQYPDAAAGPPLAARQAELSTLEREIAELNKNLEEMQGHADALGTALRGQATENPDARRKRQN